MDWGQRPTLTISSHSRWPGCAVTFPAYPCLVLQVSTESDAPPEYRPAQWRSRLRHRSFRFLPTRTCTVTGVYNGDLSATRPISAWCRGSISGSLHYFLTRIPSTDSQSSSRTITSWIHPPGARSDTGVSSSQSGISQSLASTVGGYKYSRTVNPSRKLALMGKSIILPEGSAINPRIPAS